MLSLGPSRLLSLLYISITLGLLLADHAQAKFLRADLSWTGLRKARHDDVQPNLTDLLAFRDLDQDPLLEKAMRVIDTLAAQSTCHQAAAAQLLVTCKAVGSDLSAEQGKHELLERAKSVYAVRVAVCETGEGRAAVPPTCKPMLDIPPRLGHEIDVVSTKTLSSCLEALMVEHYYWTSYSNNRQDANTLCQATTLEGTRLEALHSYQKLAELLPEFRNILVSTRSQWLEFIKQQEHDVQNVNKLQRQNREEFEQQHNIELGAFRQAMNMAKDGLQDVSKELQRAMANTGSDISHAHEALGYVLADFTSLRTLLHEAISTTSQNNAEVAAAQARDMNSVHELAIATTETLKQIQADEAVRDVNGLFYRVKAELDQIIAAQSTHLATTEHHLRLTEKLTHAQEANLDLGEQMRDSSTSLASELNSANVVAGRVSTKLEKVNQALTRVEQASSVLNAFLAFITIPCHLAEHLHLRLLGLFATPAIALSFWKPRRYAYSLMAVYVFVESMLSYVAEYKDKFSTYIWLLVCPSRAVPTWGLRVLNQNIPLAAWGVAFFICYYLLTVLTPKPKPKFSPMSKIANHDDEDYKMTDRYYIEHRLRSGKHLRLSSDRYRRAATVC